MVVTSGSVYHLTAAGDLAQARGEEAMKDDLVGHNKELEETVGCLSLSMLSHKVFVICSE
jgi:hypothetical protein